MDTDMDTFVTALYLKIDDELRNNPSLRIWRPEVGTAPELSDAELITMAVLQALLGFTSETCFLRHARKHLRSFFPTCRSSRAATSACASLRTSSGP